MRRQGGFSLVEMLVTMGLLVVLAGAISWLLVAVKLRWQAGASRAAVRQDLQTTLWQLDQEVRNTEGSLMTDGTTSIPSAFGFPSACDSKGVFITDSAGGATWQKFVIYYVPSGTTRLLRKEVYTLPSVPPIQLTNAQLVGYCDGKGALVADGVLSMRLSVDANNGSATVSLTLRNKSAQGTTDDLSASLYIFTRN